MHENIVTSAHIHAYRYTERLTLGFHPAAAHHPEVLTEISSILEEKKKETEISRMMNGTRE